MLARRMRELLSTSEKLRDRNWILDHLQIAVQLELSTLPPYLTAMWSVRRVATQVVATLDEVIRAEMTHMGMVCNLFNAVGHGKSPIIADPSVVPTYPGHLPGGVHIDLEVSLQRLSKNAVANVFMKIEEPARPEWVWHQGEMWPTIGAFYLALENAVKQLPDEAIKPERQISSDVVTIPVKPIRNKYEALAAISTIRAQGEGTNRSPLFGPNPETDIAHYFRFGESYHEKRLVSNSSTMCWSYSGDDVPFPDAQTGIFPMAMIPHGGYAESLEFDHVYSDMLRDLQRAWNTGSSDALNRNAVDNMKRLAGLARGLMGTTIPGGSGETFGPDFRFFEQ